MYRSRRLHFLTGTWLPILAVGYAHAAQPKPEPTPSVPVSPRVLITRDLGRCQGLSLRCKLLFLGTRESGTYTAKFIATDRRGETRVIVQTIDDGFGPRTDAKMPSTRTLGDGWDEWSLAAEDYIGAGHKQIFVSSKTRMTHSFLLDFNGRDVRVLYERNDVFCSELSRTKHGHWIIEELWREDSLHGDGPAYEIVDEWKYSPYTQEEAKEHAQEEREEHGLKERSRKNVNDRENDHGVLTASRVLHWDGKAFVPDKIGATRIIRVTQAKYEKLHDLPAEKMYLAEDEKRSHKL